MRRNDQMGLKEKRGHDIKVGTCSPIVIEWPNLLRTMQYSHQWIEDEEEFNKLMLFDACRLTYDTIR